MTRFLVLCSLLLATPARAAEEEVVIPKTARVTGPVTMQGGRKVLLYGPVAVPPHLKTTKDTIFMYLDGATFGGHAGSVEIYLAFPRKGAKKGAPIRVDRGDYVSGEGAMEDGRTLPMTRLMEVHDFESRGQHFRALTHLQAASEVMVALVSPTDNFEFERVVITTQAPGSRPMFHPPQAP